jgi:hypothetical protein
MKWTQWNPERADALRTLGMVVLLIAAFAAVTIYLPNLEKHRAEAGFGPHWDCVMQARGDPVCIKKVQR